MAVQQINVPDIGDFKDVDVIEVLVQPGDALNAEDPMITLESDKASMEVPAPKGGTVKEVLVKVGDKVSEGSAVLMLDVEGAAEASSAPSQTASTSSSQRGEGVGSSSAAASASSSQSSEGESKPSPAAGEGGRKPGEGVGGRVYASPSVRRIARELGVDLAQIPASGAKGRITKDDVQNFVKGGVSKAAAPGASAAPSDGMTAIPPIPAVDFSQFGEIEEKPLSRIQKISGPHLHRVWLNVPMVTHHDEADVTEMEDFRKSLKAEAEKKGLRVTGLVFIMKALANAMQAFPKFNSSLSPDGQSLVYKKYFHIGIAVDTPNGLVVPVFRDVDKKSIYDLSTELGEVSKKARDGKLSPKDLSGGCMSISSLGGIGGTAFTPIVNAPEVAILGVTRSQMKPVWNGKEFIPRLMMPLDLTYDHRVIDGAEAARFMVHLCQTLTDIRRILL